MSTSSTFNINSIINAALADYTKITGTNLSETPFAIALEQSNSLEAVLQLLHDREMAFEGYRDSDRKLISCISPTVKVLQVLSGIACEAVSHLRHVSHTYYLATLLTVTSSDPFPTSKSRVCRDRSSP